MTTLRAHGTNLLIDTHGWRFRHESAHDVRKLTAASWAPTSPVLPTDRTAVGALVEAGLRAQAALDAGAYFLPGLLPTAPDEDLRSELSATRRRRGRRSRHRAPEAYRSRRVAGRGRDRPACRPRRWPRCRLRARRSGTPAVPSRLRGHRTRNQSDPNGLNQPRSLRPAGGAFTPTLCAIVDTPRQRSHSNAGSPIGAT